MRWDRPLVLRPSSQPRTRAHSVRSAGRRTRPADIDSLSLARPDGVVVSLSSGALPILSQLSASGASLPQPVLPAVPALTLLSSAFVHVQYLWRATGPALLPRQTLEDWEVAQRCTKVLDALRACSDRVILESKRKKGADSDSKFLMRGAFDG